MNPKPILHSRPPRAPRRCLLALVNCCCVFSAVLHAAVGGQPSDSHSDYHIAFDRDQYIVDSGGTFTVHVELTPVPGRGVFSYGIMLELDPAAARVDGASALAVPSPLAFDGPRANTPVTAVGNGFAAVKGTAEFFNSERPVSTESLLASFVVTDLGSLPSYELHLSVFNTLGPTEQVFVDGSGAVLDGRTTLGTAVVTRPRTLEVQSVGSIALNRQSGLFEQTVRIANPGSVAVPAFRLQVTELPLGWEVRNAHGITNGIPWVDHNRPLPVGQSVELRVEYRIPDRNPQSQPAYAVGLVMPVNDPDPPDGTPFTVMPRDQLKDGAFLLEFSSLTNRQYLVQYSRNLETWITVQPPLTGNGSRLQWIDYGPPKTDSPPAGQTNRYYRVFLLP